MANNKKIQSNTLYTQPYKSTLNSKLRESIDKTIAVCLGGD